jgi:membrane-associated phospholipid phosphatase
MTRGRLQFLPLLLLGFALNLSAQLPTPTPSPTPKTTSAKPSFLKDFLYDQKMIWTAPFRLHREDAKWLLPLTGVAAVAIGTDEKTSSWIDRRGTMHPISRDISYGGSPYTNLSLVGSMYLLGRTLHNKRLTETGRLSFEALLDASVVTGVVKHITRRPRPNYDNGEGTFFWGGGSFPSGHSSSAFSIATVVAYEYHNKPLIRYGAWGAATAISMSRFTGRDHFLSEVLIGGALGFYTGRFVYKAHHRDHADDDDKNAPPPLKTTTRLFPTISPLYDARTATYGARAMWSF